MTSTTTEAAEVIEKVVSAMAQETLIASSMLLGTIDDRSSEVRPGMDRLDLARFSAPAVQDVTEGSEVTEFTVDPASDQLDLNKNKAIHWRISDRASLQSKLALAEQTVKDAAKAQSDQIDNDIMGELVQASAAAPDHRIVMTGTGGVELTRADVVNARKLLNEQNVPMSDRFMAVPPNQEAVLLNINEFVDVDKYGSREAILNGEIGRLFGFRVILVNVANLATDEAVFYHRSAVAYASQMAPKFETDRNIKKLEDEYTLSRLYGVKLLDSGVRQVLYNNDGL